MRVWPAHRVHWPELERSHDVMPDHHHCYRQKTVGAVDFVAGVGLHSPERLAKRERKGAVHYWLVVPDVEDSSQGSILRKKLEVAHSLFELPLRLRQHSH